MAFPAKVTLPQFCRKLSFNAISVSGKTTFIFYRRKRACLPNSPDIRHIGFDCMTNISASRRKHLLNKIKAEQQDFSLVLTRCGLKRLQETDI